jgi:Protein of unknown function (DUF2510)
MKAPTPDAGWYPDPENPTRQRYWDGIAWTPRTPPVSVAEVFGRSLLYGLVIGVLAGMASGTAGAPVLGTIIGAFVGLAIAVPASLVVAGAIAISARPPVTAKAYRRRVDVTLVILAVGAAAVAAVWINQRALFGPWPALAMLATVVLCLIGVRPLLRRLVPAQATSSG